MERFPFVAQPCGQQVQSVGKAFESVSSQKSQGQIDAHSQVMSRGSQFHRELLELLPVGFFGIVDRIAVLLLGTTLRETLHLQIAFCVRKVLATALSAETGAPS